MTKVACTIVALWMALVLFPLGANGQTITITGGVQTYDSLTNVTVIMTGQCELRLASSNSPLSGCTINLNSTNAFIMLLNVKPSTVVASYLSQVFINGAAAVADSNCRVVEFGMGAVVVPHSPSFQPLQIFTQPHFTGSSGFLGQYVYYTGTGLGLYNGTISSFKLKRGYMATFAQNTSGSGLSKCYVAQDGDMEVSVLPAGFDNSIRFVYVVPWRWTSKKGIAGDPGISQLNVKWWYNWNINQNSSRDLEYQAIRQTNFWPSLSQNWQTRGINTVLGYNEPDHFGTVSTAISLWPDLLGTGLRVGSPATTDGGWSSWLYPFMTQADVAGLRVDFVAVHYYQCHTPSDAAGTATQMYNALKAIYDQTKRPLWITEWNNGANWTTCGDPTYAQQQAAIAATINMLDTTPFVERYALYNWVEDVRGVTTNGTLTPAGVTYRDQVSPIGYVQALQPNGTRSYTQLRFENNTQDTSGYGNNGISSGTPAYTNGQSGQAMVFDGTNTVVTLPPNVATNASFSFAAWVYWNGGNQWQRIFDFGNSTTHYMFLTPRSGNDTLRFAIKNGGTELRVDGPQLPANQWVHLAYTQSGATGKLYTNGVAVTTSNSVSIAPSAFSPRVNRLGKGQFADPLFSGQLDEVLITDYALSAAQIAGLMTNTPPQFSTNIYTGGSAVEGQVYSNSISGTASDVDPGDTLTYGKAVGPAWLNVAADGTLGGTPTSADGGTNFFTVSVTDTAGQSAFALVTISVTTVSSNGTWIADADGVWSDPTRWSSNIVATGNGGTANFSTINITGNRTVTLNTSRTIGALKFRDTSGSQSWTITNSSGSVLTLDTVSSQPVLVVSNTVTITAPIAGTNGFNKSGPGTLILGGNNPLSGSINVDPSTNLDAHGIVRVISPGALGNVTNIFIRSNNSGYSTFQLDGSVDDISINSDWNITCRNNTNATIENLAGTNVLAGFIHLDVGGNSFNIQSDAGLLELHGTNQYLGSLTGGRNYNFTGAGDHLVSGPILNSINGAPISLVKSGTGILTLSETNTYGAGTTVSNGTLLVDGSIIGTVTVVSSATLGGNGVIKGPVTVQSGGSLSPGSSIGTLTVSNTLSLSGTTYTELDKSVPTNDTVLVIGTVSYGGTLTATNLAGTLLGGDSFQLFNAGSFANSFGAMKLPPLSPGLGWNFNPTNGFLTVVTTGPTNPSGLIATAGNAQVALSWSTLSGATSYNVKSSTNSGGPYAIIGTPGATSLSDTGLVNGTAYYYVVSGVNAGGESGNSAEVSAIPLSAFQSWQSLYFGCWACPQADTSADPDGDGQNNQAEWLAGTDPTNSASVFQIVSVTPVGEDIVVTWRGGVASTGALQAANGDYSTNFVDVSGAVVMPGSGLTNYPDAGAATNGISRFYRVRLLP